jgi:peptidoglycan/xylan/chitin deacetylase (PgdA/CDA1 family)
VRPWLPIVLGFKGCAVALAIEHQPVAALVAWVIPDPWIIVQFLATRAQGFGPVMTRFVTEEREVWLTIDDGPDPESTPKVLELLRSHGAKATFFLVGERVARHPDLARRIVAEGHTIGNHSHTHPHASFWCALPGRTAAEIDGCVGALLLADAPFERYFRPPVGFRNPFLEPQLSSRGMRLVLWSARGYDGVGNDPRKAFWRIARDISPGAILLAHEGGPGFAGRLAFLTLVLEHLTEARYSCVLPRAADLRN